MQNSFQATIALQRITRQEKWSQALGEMTYHLPPVVIFLPICSNNFSNEEKVIGEEYEEFSNNEGAVSWQGGMFGID